MPYFQKAQQVRRRLYEQINMIFNDFDVLLMPTSPSTAFKMGENPNDPVAMYLADIFTVLANLVGIPVSPSRYINTATACHSGYRL